MSAVTDRHRIVGAAGTVEGARSERVALVIRHRASLIWIGGVLAVSGAVSFVNLGGSPQRIDDEGTYTAQAYAVANWGELAHYTFWYDHPPLGWIQLALYGKLTGAFARYPIAVLAGREAVVIASLISVVLIWAIARRIGLSRPAAGAAGLLFAVSPLALQFHRTVYLDNIATPWLLAAVLMVLEKRAQLGAYAGAAVCFGIAVLSKETYLVALPVLIWLAVRGAHRSTRRYTLAVAGSILTLVGGGYLLLAVVKGELLPRSGQVSLIDGVMFQLSSRDGSGSPFDASSLTRRVLSQWWQLDPVFIVAGLAAAVVALLSYRLRPFAVLLLAATLFMFRPGGYLPVPYVVMLLPLAALLVPAVVDLAIRNRRPGGARRARMTVAIVASVAAVAAAVPLWGAQLRGFLFADLDAPMRSAVAWVGDNVPKGDRLIVDDSMWVDLVRQGRERRNVVWYYKVDTDPAVKAQSPNGWKDSDYIVTTDSMRTFPDAFPQVQKALTGSVRVASWGRGSTRVDVRRIVPYSAADRRAAASQVAEDARAAGRQIAANPNLSLPTTSRRVLEAAQVDPRISVALGAQLAAADVRVSGFPKIQGDTSEIRRRVLVDTVGGRPVADPTGRITAAGRGFLSLLDGPYRPLRTTVQDGRLLLTYPADVVISGID